MSRVIATWTNEGSQMLPENVPHWSALRNSGDWRKDNVAGGEDEGEDEDEEEDDDRMASAGGKD